MGRTYPWAVNYVGGPRQRKRERWVLHTCLRVDVADPPRDWLPDASDRCLPRRVFETLRKRSEKAARGRGREAGAERRHCHEHVDERLLLQRRGLGRYPRVRALRWRFAEQEATG